MEEPSITVSVNGLLVTDPISSQLTGLVSWFDGYQGFTPIKGVVLGIWPP